jgi:D-alanyl-D-alanine carboxypeptidase (penicillin-binding protein 5/6)
LNDNIQFSTARDLAIITAAALENELFAEIFGVEDYVLPATNLSDARKIYTTNYMLSDAKVKGYADARVTGGKTAAATQTERSLICTAEIGTARYLCVVMNADSVMSEDNISVVSFGSFVETAQLLDFAEQNYEVRQVLDDSQAFSQYGVQGGGSDIVVSPGGDMFTVLPLDFSAELLQLSTSIDSSKLVAPLKKGDVLGYVRVTYGTVILGEYPLAAMFDVPYANTVIRPADPILPDEDNVQESHVLRWILILVGIIVFAYLLVVLCVRIVRNARIRDLHRRRKRNRRRSR